MHICAQASLDHLAKWYDLLHQEIYTFCGYAETSSGDTEALFQLKNTCCESMRCAEELLQKFDLEVARQQQKLSGAFENSAQKNHS